MNEADKLVGTFNVLVFIGAAWVLYQLFFVPSSHEPPEHDSTPHHYDVEACQMFMGSLDDEPPLNWHRQKEAEHTADKAMNSVIHQLMVIREEVRQDYGTSSPQYQEATRMVVKNCQQLLEVAN